MASKKATATNKKTATKQKAPAKKATAATTSIDSDPIVALPDAGSWHQWLAEHHATSNGVWLHIAKKASRVASPTQNEAVEVALLWGWIDSQKRAYDADTALQRFSPRRAKSPWSRINRDKAEAFIAAGKMMPAGLEQVERAKADGRWERAYEPPSRSTVPDDLAVALARDPKAAAFFATLSGANRFAILYRLQEAKKPETRARRLAKFVEMLARGEKIHS